MAVLSFCREKTRIAVRVRDNVFSILQRLCMCSHNTVIRWWFRLREPHAGQRMLVYEEEQVG